MKQCDTDGRVSHGHAVSVASVGVQIPMEGNDRPSGIHPASETSSEGEEDRVARLEGSVAAVGSSPRSGECLHHGALRRAGP